METQIPNSRAPKIPPKLWQTPNNTEEIKIAKVTSNSLLNLLKNNPLNNSSSIIGESITTVKK